MVMYAAQLASLLLCAQEYVFLYTWKQTSLESQQIRDSMIDVTAACGI